LDSIATQLMIPGVLLIIHAFSATSGPAMAKIAEEEPACFLSKKTCESDRVLD